MNKPERKYKIIGGHPLRGEITVPGAKNAINKQLVASLLTEEPCVFHNVPRILEIDTVLEMIKEVGTNYEWIGENSLRVHTPKILSSSLSQKYSGVNRIPVLMAGPLLHRSGVIKVPVVGGCNIGPRPVDFHIEGLKRMGVNFEDSEDYFSASASQLVGCDFTLPFPSIGATENIILAACLAKGTTVISNAAIEPEVIDTILVLQKMGARIFIDAGRKIIIEGVSVMNGVTHTVVPDRMEVTSFAFAAIATNGRVKVMGAKHEHIVTLINTVRKMGAEILVEDDGVTFFRKNGNLVAIHLETDVHPGFMTDWQQPLVVTLTQADGASVIHETMYENRFGFTKALNEMGAQISLSNYCLGHKECRYTNKNFLHSAVVVGPTPLAPKNLVIPDLRAGFAYVIAALVAKGESIVSGIYHVERGHENLPERLRAIGANIEFI